MQIDLSAIRHAEVQEELEPQVQEARAGAGAQVSQGLRAGHTSHTYPGGRKRAGARALVRMVAADAAWRSGIKRESSTRPLPVSMGGDRIVGSGCGEGSGGQQCTCDAVADADVLGQVEACAPAGLELADLIGERVRTLLQALHTLAKALLRGEDRLLPVSSRVAQPLVCPAAERL